MDGKSRSRNGRYGEGTCGGLWDFLEPLSRLLGVATAVVMSGVGVEMSVHRHMAGVYIIIASGIVFFLEIMWVITLFIDLCTNHEEYTPALRCWDLVSSCRGWRKAPAYIVGGLIMIFWPRWLWLARIAGVQLLLLGALHGTLQVRPRPRDPLLPDQHHHLVGDAASDYGGDRYDDITEVLDDSMPTPIGANNVHMNSNPTPSLREQETILEI